MSNTPVAGDPQKTIKYIFAFKQTFCMVYLLCCYCSYMYTHRSSSELSCMVFLSGAGFDRYIMCWCMLDRQQIIKFIFVLMMMLLFVGPLLTIKYLQIILLYGLSLYIVVDTYIRLKKKIFLKIKQKIRIFKNSLWFQKIPAF